MDIIYCGQVAATAGVHAGTSREAYTLAGGRGINGERAPGTDVVGSAPRVEDGPVLGTGEAPSNTKNGPSIRAGSKGKDRWLDNKRQWATRWVSGSARR